MRSGHSGQPLRNALKGTAPFNAFPSFRLESAATAIRACIHQVIRINEDIRASTPRTAEFVSTLGLLLVFLAARNVIELAVGFGNEVLICHGWPHIVAYFNHSTFCRYTRSAIR